MGLSSMRYGYPTLIQDDFFSNPKEIVKFANTLEYYPDTIGAWPGKRTKSLDQIDYNFFDAVFRRILANYYSHQIRNYEVSMFFQKSFPYTKNQYDPKNLGWIHVDQGIFGGLIYLTENPEKDTGTSLYDLKNLFFNYPSYMEETKRKFYLQNNIVKDNEYNNTYKLLTEQFKETVNVQSKYNRLFTFDGNQFHALQTIGIKERLTLIFFCKHLVVDSMESYHGSRLF